MILPYDLLCASRSTKADFLDFIDQFDGIIANQSTWPAEVVARLDKDGDGTLTADDRDVWLDAVLKNTPSLTDKRLPWDVGGASSDPLNLSRGNAIIIDPQNPAAVKCVRGSATNDVTLIDGTPDGSLFNGDGTYRRRIWHSLESLDELHWDTAGATVRRFPANTNPVTIYVRGGDQTMTKEIGIFNNGGGPVPSRIVIRNYPGERPRIFTGGSKIEAGDPVSSGNAYAGEYRMAAQMFGLFRDCTIDGLEVVGYRLEGSDKIFAHNVFRGSSKVKYFRLNLNTYRGISPTAADAGPYPSWIDFAFDRRYRYGGTAKFLSRTDLATSGAGSTTLTSAAGGFNSSMVNMYIRISGGTNFVVGMYRVSGFTNANTVTLATSPTPSGAGSAGAGKVGAIDPEQSFGDLHQPRSFIELLGAGSVVKYCSLAQGQAGEAPSRPDSAFGDAIWINATDCEVTHNKFRGRQYHNQVFSREGALRLNLSYNDGENFDHTVFGVLGNGTKLNYNRAHRYGQSTVDNHAGLQFEGITGGQCIGNVVWDAGLTSGHWGLALFAYAAGPWELRGNEIAYNIIYRCGATLNHTTGDVDPPLVHDNWIHHNVIIDTAPGNEGLPEDAPLFVQINDGQNNNAYGNRIEYNVLRRLDDSTAKMITWVAGVYTSYYEGGKYPLFIGNTSDDPKFKDPQNGDFTLLAGSPLFGVLPADVPLKEVATEDDELANLCAARGVALRRRQVPVFRA